MFDAFARPLAWVASLFAAAATLVSPVPGDMPSTPTTSPPPPAAVVEQAPVAVTPATPTSVAVPAAPQPATPAAEPVKPSSQPVMEQKKPERRIEPMREEFKEDDRDGGKDQQRPMNHQWYKDTTRNMRDLVREVSSLAKRAKNTKGVSNELLTQVTDLLAKVKDYQAKLATAYRAPDADLVEELLREFHDERFWDAQNGIRARIELPRELQDIEKSLKKITKLIAQKSFLAVQELGIDVERIKADVAARYEVLTKVRALLDGGNPEEAQEEMQIFHEEGGHPGEMESAMHGLRDVANQLKRMKNPEIREIILEILQPVLEAMQENDYREARMSLEEIRRGMEKVFERLYRYAADDEIDNKTRQLIEAAQEKLEAKLQALGGQQESKEGN